MKYICTECNYSTNNKSNFDRHNNSNAHMKKLGLLPKKLPLEKKNICVCGKIFKHRSGLSRHKQTCKIIVEQYKKEDIDLKIQVAEIKDMMQQLLKASATSQLIHSQTINNQPTYKLSVKNYLQKFCADAPTIEAPNDYAKLTFENQTLIDTLLYYYRHKSLHKHLGDFIIGYYKKDDPSKQSVWTSDVARLTYIIKESLAGKESIWNQDPKGVKVKRFIITPMLDHIRKYMNEYWDEIIANDELTIKKKNKNKVDIDALEKRQKMFNGIHAIRQEIDNGILADDIIKYIASYLHLDIQNNNL